MPDQPSGAQPNADVTEAGQRLGEEYDKNREKRADEQSKDSEKLGEGRNRVGGAVVTGEGYTGEVTTFPGAGLRGLAGDHTEGGVAARAAKGLDTDGITVEDSTWTAQSAVAYVSSNAEDVPGQTFTADELPDAAVVGPSALPAHSIPAHLVVDDARTDSVSPSQERGGDLGTAPVKVDGKTQVARPRTSAGGSAG